MNTKQFYTYGIYYPNRKLFYIGKRKVRKGRDNRLIKTITKCDYNHLKKNIIAKIKRSGKEPIVKIIKDNLTENQAFSLEKKLIKQYGRRDLKTGILANLTDGGEGASGAVWSKKSRKRASKIHTGKVLTEEHKKNIGLAQSGKVNSKETRRKMSEACKKRYRDNPESNPMYNNTHTEEAREKISIAKMGNPSKTGLKDSDKTRLKKSKAKKLYWAKRKLYNMMKEFRNNQLIYEE